MSTPASVDASPIGPPEQPPWISVGRHRCYRHGDMVFLQTCGVASVDEMAQLLAPVWETQQAQGRAFLILDAREAVPASPQLRRFLADWYRQHPTQGRTIIFGAGPLVRATVALLNAAARILSRRVFVQELFVATEPEAWAALQQERQRFLQGHPASAVDSPAMLLVLSTLYGAYGGIPAFNRLLVQAAADFCLRLRQPLSVLALTDADGTEPAAAQRPAGGAELPPRVQYTACAGDRRALIAAYLRHLGRPLPVVFGHVNLAPLGLIWPGPVGVIAHGSEVYARLPPLRRWAVRRATRIAAVSDHTRRCLIDGQGVSPARCVRVVNALPSLPVMPPPSQATSGLRLLCISRLHPDEPKGVDVLLRALARLPDAAASLTVIGDGDARPALQALARELGLSASRVRFLGHVPDVIRDAELDACDVFVLPSESEGFGIVYLEALARGKPCIAAQAGGAPEIVLPEQTGLLIPVPAAAHVADLSAALLRLSDPVLRARLGAAGRRRVEQDHCAAAFAQRAQAFFAALQGRASVAEQEL